MNWHKKKVETNKNVCQYCQPMDFEIVCQYCQPMDFEWEYTSILSGNTVFTTVTFKFTKYDFLVKTSCS